MKAIDLFLVNRERVERLLDVHVKAYPKGKPSPGQEAGDILRSAVVFAVAALDTYMHARISEVVKEKIYKGKTVPFHAIKVIDKHFKDKEKTAELLKISLSNKPLAKILSILWESLSGQTFQKPSQIEKAFNIMEIGKPWEKINLILNTKRGPKKRGKKQKCQTFLLEISDRRDKIVHEGDTYITGKKLKSKLRNINRTWATDSLNKLTKFIFVVEKLSSQ